MKKLILVSLFILSARTVMADRWIVYTATITSGVDCAGKLNGGKLVMHGADASCEDDISGSGGSSTLAIGTGTAANFTNKVTSPTAAISLRGDQFLNTTVGTTNFIALNPSYILLNQNSLQSGSTFYVSSGTIQGKLSMNTDGSWVSGNILSVIPNNSQNGFLHVADHLIHAQLNRDGSTTGDLRIRSSTAAVSDAAADYSEIQVHPPTSSSDGQIVFGFKSDQAFDATRTNVDIFKQRALTFYDSNGTSHYTALKASATLAGTDVFILPPADGTSGQALTTDGNHNLSFTTISGGAGGSGSPLEVFNNNDGTRSSPTVSIGLSNAFRGTVTSSSYTLRINFSSVASQNDLAAYFLLASSTTLLTTSSATATYFAKSSVYVASLTVSSALTITGSNNVSGGAPIISANSSSTTLQGNIFNGASQLVQLDSNSKLPAVDGSQVVRVSSLAASGVTAGSYTNTNLTVDAQGRITTASNGTAGSGASTLGIGTGTASNYTNNVSSPASSLSFEGMQFKVTNLTGTTAYVLIDTMSSTGVMALSTGTNGAGQLARLTSGSILAAAQFPALTGMVTNAAGSLATTVGAISLSTGVTGSLPAASVAAGSLGSSVIASSIAVNAVLDASIVSVSANKITGNNLPSGSTNYIQNVLATPVLQGATFYVSSGTSVNFNASTITIGSPLAVSLPNNPLSIGGNANGPLQVNIQNTNTGTFASADYIVTSDLGSNTSFYADFGINSSTNGDSNFSVTKASDSYLYAANRSLVIGTQENVVGSSVCFFTGGTSTSNVRMGITNTGTIYLPGLVAGPLKTIATSSSVVVAAISLSSTSDITGTLQAAQFPALTGQATTSAGSFVTTVQPISLSTGVTGSLPAASIAAGSLGSGVISSSIALNTALMQNSLRNGTTLYPSFLYADSSGTINLLTANSTFYVPSGTMTINGINYLFPNTKGANLNVLTSDGGTNLQTLSWASTPNSAGVNLSTSVISLSTGVTSTELAIATMTITPTSTSAKIQIWASVSFMKDAGATARTVALNLRRGTNPASTGNVAFSTATYGTSAAVAGATWNVSNLGLDTPNSTASQTYTITAKTDAGVSSATTISVLVYQLAGGGIGDAVLAATQTFSGVNTFASSTTFINVSTVDFSAVTVYMASATIGQTNLVISSNVFQVGTSTTLAFTSGGNLESHQINTPTVSACGTGSPTVTALSTNRSGSLTTGTAASSCLLTFGGPGFTQLPNCTVTGSSLISFPGISSRTTQSVTFGISGAVSADILYWICEGNQ